MRRSLLRSWPFRVCGRGALYHGPHAWAWIWTGADKGRSAVADPSRVPQVRANSARLFDRLTARAAQCSPLALMQSPLLCDARRRPVGGGKRRLARRERESNAAKSSPAKELITLNYLHASIRIRAGSCFASRFVCPPSPVQGTWPSCGGRCWRARGLVVCLCLISGGLYGYLLDALSSDGVGRTQSASESSSRVCQPV